jgi:hypothetical protein
MSATANDSCASSRPLGGGVVQHFRSPKGKGGPALGTWSLCGCGLVRSAAATLTEAGLLLHAQPSTPSASSGCCGRLPERPVRAPRVLRQLEPPATTSNGSGVGVLAVVARDATRVALRVHARAVAAVAAVPAAAKRVVQIALVAIAPAVAQVPLVLRQARRERDSTQAMTSSRRAPYCDDGSESPSFTSRASASAVAVLLSRLANANRLSPRHQRAWRRSLPHHSAASPEDQCASNFRSVAHTAAGVAAGVAAAASSLLTPRATSGTNVHIAPYHWFISPMDMWFCTNN